MTTFTTADRVRAAAVTAKARLLVETAPPDVLVDPHRSMLLTVVVELADLVQAMETRIAQLENELLAVRKGRA